MRGDKVNANRKYIQSIYTSLSCCTKFSLNWMKDSHVRPKALNLIQEKVGDTLQLVGTGKDLLNRTSVVQALRPTVGKWDTI